MKRSLGTLTAIDDGDNEGGNAKRIRDEQDADQSQCDNNVHQEDKKKEPLDMLTVLVRMMPARALDLLKMLRTRDICSLVATSHELAVEYFDIYHLGMVASLGGHLSLIFADTAGGSVGRIVQVRPLLRQVSDMMPGETFREGERLSRALRNLSVCGDHWLSILRKITTAPSAREDEDNEDEIPEDKVQELFKASARLQRHYIEVFDALNGLTSYRGARAFVETVENILRASQAIDTNTTDKVKLAVDYHSSETYYEREGVVPLPFMDFHHDMWLSLERDPAYLPSSPRDWHPTCLWIARYFGHRSALRYSICSERDTAGLVNLLLYLRTNVEFAGASRDIDDILLDWTSEENLKAVRITGITGQIAHAAFCLLWTNAIADERTADHSMATLCSIITRACRCMGFDLPKAVDFYSKQTGARTFGPAWHGVRFCKGNVKALYKRHARITAEERQQRDPPLLKFLNAMSEALAVTEANSDDDGDSRPDYDKVESLTRMRRSLEFSRRCIESTTLEQSVSAYAFVLVVVSSLAQRFSVLRQERETTMS